MQQQQQQELNNRKRDNGDDDNNFRYDAEHQQWWNAYVYVYILL